jgi:hypothetical protein
VANQDEHLAAPPLAKAPLDAEQAGEYQKAWAKYLGVPVVTTNARAAAPAHPPGEFTMGVMDAEAEAGRSSTKTTRTAANGPPTGPPEPAVLPG